MISNTNIIVIIILLVVIIIFYTSYTEKFTTLEDIKNTDILPIYKNITPKDFITYFGSIDNITKVFIANNIPHEYMIDKSKYPIIATYLHLKM